MLLKHKDQIENTLKYRDQKCISAIYIFKGAHVPTLTLQWILPWVLVYIPPIQSWINVGHLQLLLWLASLYIYKSPEKNSCVLAKMVQKFILREWEIGAKTQVLTWFVRRKLKVSKHINGETGRQNHVKVGQKNGSFSFVPFKHPFQRSSTFKQRLA